MTTTMHLLESAVELHRAGQLADAEPIYRSVLRDQPNNVDALYLLGTVQFQRGELGSASLFLKRAIAANPQHAEALNNFGLVLLTQSKSEESIDFFKRAIKRQPKYADACYNLGNAYRACGRLSDAVASYRSALRIRKDWPEALDNLSLALRDLDRLNEALEASLEAARLAPRSAIVWNNLGAVQKSLGDYSAASASFAKAVAIDPRNAIARSNLGIAKAHLGELKEAERECREAVVLNPSAATAHNNLGLVLYLAGKELEAVGEFLVACEQNPEFADAMNNLGSAFFRLRRENEAIEQYRRSIAVKPSTLAHKNLASILEHTCQWSEARESFLEAARLRGNDPLLELRAATVCPTVFDSRDEIHQYRKELDEQLDRSIEARIKRPFSELLDMDIRPSFAWQFQGLDDRRIREKMAQSLAGCFDGIETPAMPTEKPSVGFLVAPGHEYAFVRSLAGMFLHFNRDEWRPVVVCAERGEGVLRESADLADAEMMVVPEHATGLISSLRAARFDMLYHWEIATGAMNYVLPFMKVAPIQCTSWGIQVTSGIDAIDYYVSSELIEDDAADVYYTEKLIRLKTMLSYQRMMPIPPQLHSREDLGLSHSGNVYLCAQQLGKFHPDFDPILRRILERDPTGELVIVQSRFGEENRRLASRMKRTLGSVFEQVRFIPKRVGPSYASLVSRATVILDPTHFGGVNTTYDAVSAGKVTVTMPSPFNKGRYTLGCHKRIGVLDGVARSPDEYVELAVRLATEPDYRRDIEAKIADRRDILFECVDSVRELEQWMLETIHGHRSKSN